jgi:hypothetical protein
MFCKRRHYKNPTCFGHHSMTILRGRPSLLVHLPRFSCTLRHMSVLVCGRMPSVCMCIRCSCCLCVVWSCFARPDNTQTATPDTHTNRGHTATNPPKKDKWRSRQLKNSKFTRNEERPPEDCHGIVTETCRVFIYDAFYRTFLTSF